MLFLFLVYWPERTQTIKRDVLLDVFLAFKSSAMTFQPESFFRHTN